MTIGGRGGGAGVGGTGKGAQVKGGGGRERGEEEREGARQARQFGLVWPSTLGPSGPHSGPVRTVILGLSDPSFGPVRPTQHKARV